MIINRLPEAGVVFIAATPSQGTIVYRFDGESGLLTPVDRLGESPGIRRPFGAGVQFGLDCAATTRCSGGQRTVAWDGTLLDPGCAGDLSKLGACAILGPSPGVWLRRESPWGLLQRAGGALTIAGPGGVPAHQVLPEDWGAVEALWSPAGDHLLLLRRSGIGPDALWVMELDGRLQKLVEVAGALPGVLPDGVTAIGWSPDGRYATFQQVSTPLHLGTYELMRLIDLASGQRIDVGPALSGDFTWSAGGQLAFVDAAGGMSLWDGTETRRVGSAPPGRTAHLPAWDATGNRLAWLESGTATSSSTVGVVVFDGRQRSELECPNGDARSVQWSRDGDALLVVCIAAEGRYDAYPNTRSDIWLWHLSGPGDGMLALVRNVPNLSTTVAWSRDATIP